MDRYTKTEVTIKNRLDELDNLPLFKKVKKNSDEYAFYDGLYRELAEIMHQGGIKLFKEGLILKMFNISENENKLAGAINSLENAVKCIPEQYKLQCRYELGKCYIQIKNWEKAREISKLMNNNGERSESLEISAIINEYTKGKECALDDYKKISKENPNFKTKKIQKKIKRLSEDIAYELILSQESIQPQESEKLEKAKNLYEELLEQEDNNPLYLNNLGYIFYKLGDFKESLFKLHDAYENDPRRRDKYRLNRENAIKNVIKEYEEEVRGFKNDWKCANKKCDDFIDFCKKAKRSGLYNEFTEYENLDDMLLEKMLEKAYSLYKLGKNRELSEVINDISKEFPEKEQNILYFIISLARKDESDSKTDFDKATKEIKEAEEFFKWHFYIDPTTDDINNLGIIAERYGKYESAFDLYELAIEKSDAELKEIYKKNKTRISMKWLIESDELNVGLVKKSFDKIKEFDINHLWFIFLESGFYNNKAKREKFLDYTIQKAETLYDLADLADLAFRWLILQDKENEESKKCYKKIKEYASGSVTSHYIKGSAYEINNQKKYEKEYKKGISLDPQNLLEHYMKKVMFDKLDRSEEANKIAKEINLFETKYELPLNHIDIDESDMEELKNIEILQQIETEEFPIIIYRRV